ncbi:MAG TPA: PH domain-containing protein [Phycisphaerae bacterium]|nr:PH domain-containing protein [Phycisphaerae bacterium]HPS52630.1 PH domain-containing protein [Phycisphaerae bacterium]
MKFRMSPSPGVVIGKTGEISLAEGLLQDGEIIIFITRASAWSILLGSFQSIMAFAIAAGVVACCVDGRQLSHETIWSVFITAAAIRLGWAILSWTGRFYVLTNRRIMRISIKNLFRPDVFDCLLVRIENAQIIKSRAEKLLGLGSIVFQISQNPYADVRWQNISNPEKALEIIRKTINKV